MQKAGSKGLLDSGGRTMLMVHIDSGNGPLGREDEWREEVLQVIGRLGRKIRDGENEGALLDTNGNTVGAWSLSGPGAG